MKIIKHRINDSSKLSELDEKLGVEIDLRSYEDEIVVSHDAFDSNAEKFEKWLINYKHDLLILNIKEEGIEEKILSIISKRNLSNFFMLDQSFPFFIRYLKLNGDKTSMRFSEFESVETIKSTINLVGKIPGWIWVDCFTGDWSHIAKLRELNDYGIKFCVVSPELQGREVTKEILKIIDNDCNIKFDAVCTKFPEIWNKYV